MNRACKYLGLLSLVVGITAAFAFGDDRKDVDMLTNVELKASVPVKVKVEKEIRVPFKAPMTSLVWSDDGRYAFATAGASTGYLIQVRTGLVKKVGFEGEGTPVQKPPHVAFARTPKSRELLLVLRHGANTSSDMAEQLVGADLPVTGVLTARRIGKDLRVVGRSNRKYDGGLCFAVGDPTDASLQKPRFLKDSRVEVRHLTTEGSERLHLLTGVDSRDAVVATKPIRIIEQTGTPGFGRGVRCSDLGGEIKWSFATPDRVSMMFISQKYQTPMFVVLPKAKTLSYLYVDSRSEDTGDNCVLVTRDLTKGKLIAQVQLPWKRGSVALCYASPTRLSLITKEGLVYLLSPSSPKKTAVIDLRGYLDKQRLITWATYAGNFVDPGIHFSVDGQKAAFLAHKGVLKIVALQEKPAKAKAEKPAKPKAEKGETGVSESAGINRLGIRNERVLQRRVSQSLWPRTVRWRR